MKQDDSTQDISQTEAKTLEIGERVLDSCTICGFARNPNDRSSHGSVRGNTSRFRDQTFQLWKCPNCQTIHSLAKVDFNDIYMDYPVNLFQKMDLFARGRFGSLLSRLKKSGLRPESRILDMGCGTGVFVQYLKEKGYSRAVGFDPYVPQFSRLDPNEKFDFVIANDVIEHVDNPRSFLRECEKRLAPNGILYVGTADSEDVDMNGLSKYLMKLHQPFHRIIVTQKTLESLGREMSGFRLLRSYKRSYMDTLKPFVNYRFLDEFNLALGHEMDLVFKKDAAKIILKKPQLLLFAFFGYFFTSAHEPAIILRKSDRKHSEGGDR